MTGSSRRDVIAKMLHRYVKSYEEQEDFDDPDLDECWTLQQICGLIAKKVMVLTTGVGALLDLDAELCARGVPRDDLARALIRETLADQYGICEEGR